MNNDEKDLEKIKDKISPDDFIDKFLNRLDREYEKTKRTMEKSFFSSDEGKDDEDSSQRKRKKHRRSSVESSVDLLTYKKILTLYLFNNSIKDIADKLKIPYHRVRQIVISGTDYFEPVKDVAERIKYLYNLKFLEDFTYEFKSIFIIHAILISKLVKALQEGDYDTQTLAKLLQTIMNIKIASIEKFPEIKKMIEESILNKEIFNLIEKGQSEINKNNGIVSEIEKRIFPFLRDKDKKGKTESKSELIPPEIKIEKQEEFDISNSETREKDKIKEIILNENIDLDYQEYQLNNFDDFDSNSEEVF